MHKLKKMFHMMLGISLIFIGILGIVLPVIHGTFFLILGLILISFETPNFEAFLSRLAKKNATIDSIYKKLLHWVQQIFGQK